MMMTDEGNLCIKLLFYHKNNTISATSYTNINYNNIIIFNYNILCSAPHVLLSCFSAVYCPFLFISNTVD